MNPPPELSVVVPFHNEAASAPALLAELHTALAGLRAEVLAVNDGSDDATGLVLEKITAGWPQLRVLTHPANRGQSAALLTGFAAVRAPWIATLDGDGQNPPAELIRLWELRHTADLLVGHRTVRRDSLLRRIMSRTANTVRRTLLGDGTDDAGCALKLMRREVLPSLIPLRTLYSFIPACAAADGWRIRPVPVAHRPRTGGRSHYGLVVMMWQPLLDMLALWWILRRRLPRPHRPAPGQEGRDA